MRVAQEGVQVCSDQRIGNMVAAMRVVNIVPAHEPYSPLTEPRHKGAVGAPTTRITGGACQGNSLRPVRRSPGNEFWQAKCLYLSYVPQIINRTLIGLRRRERAPAGPHRIPAGGGGDACSGARPRLCLDSRLLQLERPSLPLGPRRVGCRTLPRRAMGAAALGTSARRLGLHWWTLGVKRTRLLTSSTCRQVRRVIDDARGQSALAPLADPQ